jgi:hypothetical protein
VGATEAEYADVAYGCLGALQLACKRRPIDAEDPAVSHERDLLQTTAQAALAATQSSCSWFGVLAREDSSHKEAASGSKRICPMVIAMWSF